VGFRVCQRHTSLESIYVGGTQPIMSGKFFCFLIYRPIAFLSMSVFRFLFYLEQSAKEIFMTNVDKFVNVVWTFWQAYIWKGEMEGRGQHCCVSDAFATPRGVRIQICFFPGPPSACMIQLEISGTDFHYIQYRELK
jgi:hypothetical protein